MKRIKIATGIIIGCLMVPAIQGISQHLLDTSAHAAPALTAQRGNPTEPSEASRLAACHDTTYDAQTVDGASGNLDQASLLAQIRYQNIPQWVRQSFLDQKLNSRYVIAFRDIRPLYLRGDFNGDGQVDIALLLQKKTPNQPKPAAAMAVFHGGTREVKIVEGQDLLVADDIWKVMSREEMSQSLPVYSQVKLRGEGIIMGKFQSSSQLIYWDGQQYRSLQTSD
jgi:hypothetical protein